MIAKFHESTQPPAGGTAVLAESAANVLTESDAPRRVPLGRGARQRLVARCSHALYRWYVSRSQATRSWNPERSFDWRAMRHDHSERLMSVIEGFYPVEQYAPDYTAELTRLARRGFGHSQFQIAWGAEEAKHADLWRNVLLFGRARTPAQLEEYTYDLRASAWEAPFDSPLQMLFYTVFQERATQLIYLKTAASVRGGGNGDEVTDRDDVLAKAIATIAKDEAAHYDFFLALARLHLYYFPEDALEALVSVVRNFTMPASKIVPNYDSFIAALYEAQLFGPRMYGRDVARPALAALGIESVKEVEAGIASSRSAPGFDGESLRAPPPEVCDFTVLESSLTALFDRVHRYESEVGLNDVDPTEFIRVPW